MTDTTGRSKTKNVLDCAHCVHSVHCVHCVHCVNCVVVCCLFFFSVLLSI